MNRREFLKLSAASVALGLSAGCVPPANSYYDMGYVFGEVDRIRITKMLRGFIGQFPQYLTYVVNDNGSTRIELNPNAEGADPLTRKVLLDTVAGGPRVARALDQLSPNNYYKLLGITDASLGAGMRQFLFTMQCLELTLPRLTYIDPGFCSAFAARSSATTFNEPVLAKNFDHLNVTWYGCVTRRCRPNYMLPSIDNTLSILPGAISSLNPYLAITHNTLPGSMMNEQFLPGTCTDQDVAEVCRSVPDAVSFLSEVDNGGYFLLPMIDWDDNLAVVESTPYGKEVLWPERDYVVVTNHAQVEHPNAPDGAVRTVIPPDTYLRHARITELIEERLADGGKLSLEDVKAIMSDHKGGGGLDSVCRHSRLGGTISTVIMLPKSGRMFVASGPPCQTPFLEYRLD